MKTKRKKYNNTDKLLVLYLLSNNNVIAISEYEYHMRLFILQNNYTLEEYSLKVITDKKKINKYLIKYSDDLYLIEFKNFIIRCNDKKYIEDMIYCMRKDIKSLITNLESINTTCIMEPKDHEKIGKTINILNDKIRKKNIDEFINIHYLISSFFNNHSYRYDLQEMNDRYQHNILKEDLRND